MKIQKVLLAAGLAALLAPTSLSARTPPPPQAPASQTGGPATSTLRSFIERHFAEVGASCLRPADLVRPNFWSRGSREGSYIPADIENWAQIRDKMGDIVTHRPSDSLNAMFAEVYEGEGENRTLRPQQIGVTWGSGETPPMLYQQSSSYRREHNCVTIFGGDAKISARLSVVDLRAALRATTTSNHTQTAFAYAGVMVSPIAASLGLNTTAVEAPQGVSPFSVSMAIWHWYARATTPADRNKVFSIRNQIEGVALYRITGITQGDLLSGEGGLDFSLPFGSARASATASQRNTSAIRAHDFAVATWPGRADFVSLPSVADITAEIRNSAVFVPALAANAAIHRGATSIEFATDLADMPSNYCRTSLWAISAPDALDPALATLSNLRVGPVAGAPGKCRFTATATAAETDSEHRSTMGVLFAVEMRVPNIDPLGLTAPRVDIPDFRSAVSLAQGAAQAQVIFPANGAPPAFDIEFPIQTRDGVTVKGLGEATAIRIACGAAAERVLLLRKDEQARLTSNDTVLKLTIHPPQDLIAADAAGVACSLAGEVELSAGKGSASQPYRTLLPTVRFTASRAAAPPPPPGPSAAPAVGGSPGGV